MKILIWIVVIFVLLFALRLLSIAKAKRRDGTGRGGATGQPPAETMVRCARCGIYLPQKDAKLGPAGVTCGEPACQQPR